VSTATGSVVSAFADAVYAVLAADAVLATLVSGVFASLPRDQRPAFPYVVVGHRMQGGSQSAGAMQREGGKATVQVDVWSEQNSPGEAHAILSRMRALLQRTDVPVDGFTLYSGSVECDEEQCFADFDADMPSRSLFHGVQRWCGLLEEAL